MGFEGKEVRASGSCHGFPGNSIYQDIRIRHKRR